MKRILSYLGALLVLFGFSQSLSAQCYTAPFTESFDTGTQPACILISATSGGPWDFNGIFWNTSGCSPAPSDHTGNNGEFASMDQSGTDAGVILELDTVDVSSLTSPYLEFYYTMCGSGYSPVNILAVETFDGTTWVGVDTIQQGTNGWELFAYDLTGATFGTNFLKVRFRAESGGSGIDFYGDQGIDDISVIELPTCFTNTNLSASNITNNSADLSWNAVNAASSWEIEYGLAGFTPGTGTSSIVSTNPTTISSLTANSDYEFYVRAICGAGDTASWSPAGSFRTVCAPFTVTYTQGFDGTTDPNIDACWSVLNSNGSTGWVRTENSSFDPQRSSPNAIEFYNSSATSGNLLLVSPQFSDLDATKQIRFWLQNEGSTAYTSDLIVGTMSDPAVDTTFEPYDTIANSFFAFNTWTEFTINFSNLTNGDKYIAFRHGMNSTFDYIFLDDFTYEDIPSCPTPNFLSADSITSNTASLSWVENGSATNWEIEYGTSGFTQGNGTVVSTTNNPYSLSGLTAATTYDFYVRSICGPADTSAWSSAATFKSALQGPVGFTCLTGNPSVVFLDDLETTGGWTGDIGTGSTTSNWNYDAGGTGSSGTGPNAAHSGSQYVYVETSGAGVGDTASFISPAIDLSAGLNFAELSFWVHAFGSDIGTLNVDVATSASGPYTNLFTNSGAVQLQQGDPFQNVGVNLDAYVGQTIYIRFNYITNGSFEGDIALDLIEVSTCTSCSAPSNLSASNVGLTSADLSWTENGSATNWEIEYGPAGFTPGLGTAVITTTNPYNLSALSSNTTYDFYVRSICGAADTSLYSPAGSFSTLIGLPFTEDWETTPYPWSNTASTNPQWLYGGSTGSSGTGPNVDHTTGTGDFAFLETSSPSSLGDTDTLISAPIVTGANDSLLELSFWYHMHGSTMGDLQAWVFGVNNGPTLITTISGQQQPNQADPWLNYSDLVIGYENDTVRIVFVGVAGSSFYSDMAVDDISLDLPPANNLGVTSIISPVSGCGLGAADSVRVSIRNFGSAQQTGFNVGYDLNGTAITPETFTGTINPGATVTYAFATTANLSTPGTYQLRAYTALVGDANPGNDDSQTSFNSLAVAALPYSESFENGPANWFVDGISSFDLGAPAATLINTASDGDSAWVTNLTGDYNNSELGSLNSPCFDFSGTNNPWIAFDIWYDIESLWDGALMQYSTNGGTSWNTLGQLGDPFNWYNDTADVIAAQGVDPTGQCWTGDGTQSVPGSGGWITAQHDLASLSGQASVRLRLLFVSDGAVVTEGIGFDNVSVFDSIPYYPIGQINTVDANGVADSLGVTVKTSGTVVGVDLDGNNGLSFTIIDLSSNQQEGINIFNFNDVSNYVVNEGDSIMVIGDVDQFNGLQEVFVDSIQVIKTNATLPSPLQTNSLSENTESKWLELIDDFVLLDPSGTGGGSYNMDATNGTDTITIRIDSDTDIHDTLMNTNNSLVLGDTVCMMRGIGGQFDGSNPYTSGYQIFPQRWSDVMFCRLVSGVNENQISNTQLNIYPNPTNDVVTIKANNLKDQDARLMIRDINGKILFEDRLNGNSGYSSTLDLSDRAKGVYFITIIDGDKMIHRKLIKN